MMPAMRRLALWPAETLLAQPAPPDEALRGLLVLQGMARQIRAEAEELRLANAEAERRARIAAAEATVVAAAEAELRQAATALDEEIAETRLREREARATQRAEAARAQEALARANDLQDMLTALEREQARQAALAAARARQQARQPRPATPVVVPPIAAPDQPRPAPVHGRISLAFGQRGEAGPARGVTFSTAGGARVVSPCTGRAVFAGPFRRFGQIIILECGPGLHLVLAGFDALDTEAGAALLAGEALGRLGGGADGRGALYVELRRNGQVVDPIPWLGGAE
jgi:septal ring factor EnvC (AmiA/AmiB activator)